MLDEDDSDLGSLCHDVLAAVVRAGLRSPEAAPATGQLVQRHDRRVPEYSAVTQPL